jgi:hypothetical protein
MMNKLTAMRLLGMVDALKAQEQDPASRELSFLERLGLLVDHQWNWRENQALARRLHTGKLKGGDCVEEIDYQTRSTILTSQLPVTRWHEQIGDPTAADGILDRLVHNAHPFEMRGDSMRKKRGVEPAS